MQSLILSKCFLNILNFGNVVGIDWGKEQNKIWNEMGSGRELGWTRQESLIEQNGILGSVRIWDKISNQL